MAGKFDIKLNKEQQKALAAGVLMTVAFGYIYWTYFWTPISRKIADTAAKIEQTDRDIEQARAEAARLPQLRAQIQDLEEKASEAEKRLPKKREIPAVLDAISELARQSGVVITSFSPATTATKDYFLELSYPMAIRGNYHSIARFLTALALQERIFHTRNLTVTPISGANPSETIMCQLVLVAFQFKG